MYAKEDLQTIEDHAIDTYHNWPDTEFGCVGESFSITVEWHQRGEVHATIRVYDADGNFVLRVRTLDAPLCCTESF